MQTFKEFMTESVSFLGLLEDLLFGYVGALDSDIEVLNLEKIVNIKFTSKNEMDEFVEEIFQEDPRGIKLRKVIRGMLVNHPNSGDLWVVSDNKKKTVQLKVRDSVKL